MYPSQSTGAVTPSTRISSMYRRPTRWMPANATTWSAASSALRTTSRNSSKWLYAVVSTISAVGATVTLTVRARSIIFVWLATGPNEIAAP